jgi:hypothetical protein
MIRSNIVHIALNLCVAGRAVAHSKKKMARYGIDQRLMYDKPPRSRGTRPAKWRVWNLHCVDGIRGHRDMRGGRHHRRSLLWGSVRDLLLLFLLLVGGLIALQVCITRPFPCSTTQVGSSKPRHGCVSDIIFISGGKHLRSVLTVQRPSSQRAGQRIL